MFGLQAVLTGAGGLAAGLLSMWLWTRGEIAAEVNGARDAERMAGVLACNVRVNDIERTLQHAIDAAVDDAREEAAKIETVTVPADVAALCKRDPACLSRETLP